MVLKNCESEPSYILAELFNKCLNGPCFPDCWKISMVVSVFKDIGLPLNVLDWCQTIKLAVRALANPLYQLKLLFGYI